MKPSTFVVTKKVSFAGEHKSRRAKPPDVVEQPKIIGRTPRIARLMALAIHYDHLLRAGVVNNQAEIAMLCHVTRARVTQIMNMLHLAPDIQEAILLQPPTVSGRDPLHERDIRSIAAQVHWDLQRREWEAFAACTTSRRIPDVVDDCQECAF